ncbi:MAG: pyridoxal phosphate-dependent aminotransferase [Bacteroidales bacterium]|nr:pyridoxal phosphate-dependent aminotransferase [Bacteroidales bacterium]MBD5218188.1 pyridoxal phosphate-dependent aminotransferase [Bacteroidales bacterium]MBD5222107.1 pyridoxal phosphate-dependent aminotransferase [Bacteroidales bacterium]
MMQISQRVQNLAPSATLAMSQKSAELRAAGVDVINMSVGEPDFDTPDFIKEAAKKAIDENYSRYTPVAGYLSLREAVCEKLRRENGLEYTPDCIVVGNGAKQELCNVLLATINPGDEVIIPVPAWVSYVEMVKLAEGVTVTIPTGVESNFKITPAQLESAITTKTRMVMLNSPSNPTGSVYTREELQALADVLAKYPDVLILADDIYEHINFCGEVASIAQCGNVHDRVIIINGVSKAYAMTGWRIGYMAGPKEVAKAVTKLQGQYTSGASSIAQKAAEAAYNGPQDCIEDMRKAFERRRNLIVELAREIPGWVVNEPQGAFYLFPKVEAYIGKRCGDRVIESSADYVMYLLEEAHVACVDGAAFCCPGYLRMSYATSDDNIREAMRRIREASAKLV